MERLPDGWIEQPLAEVIEPRGEKVSPQEFPGFKFIGMDHVESQTTKIIGSVPASSMKSNAARFYKNDVLYGRLRPYLNKVTQPSFDGLASAEFIVFPDTDLIRSDYLKYRLNAADFVSFASHLNEGDRPRVGFDQIGAFKIKVPPPREQKRIVAKIEELFSELDKGIENLKTAREQLKVYHQAVLKHAFEGKLTATWREKNKDKLESSEELLERIRQEREAAYQQQVEEWKAAVKEWEQSGKEGKKPTRPSKPKELASFTEEEITKLPELPKGWQWVHLSRIAEKIQIGPFGSLLHKADYISDGTPLINPSHIKDQKIVPNWEFTISQEKKQDLKNYVMNENDIVMGRRGEMGRCAVVSNKENGFLCGTGSLFVRLLPSVRSDFYCYVLSSRRTKDFLAGNSIGTTMQNLNQTILHNVPIPLCGLKEQLEIMQQIESRLSAVEKLEQDIEVGQGKVEALRQSILKRAFSGKLVAQDPKDEPASVLLERIKAEKNENPKRKKKIA